MTLQAIVNGNGHLASALDGDVGAAEDALVVAAAVVVAGTTLVIIVVGVVPLLAAGGAWGVAITPERAARKMAVDSFMLMVYEMYICNMNVLGINKTGLNVLDSSIQK